MDFTTIYSKNENFVEKSVGDEMILVPLSENVADMDHVFTLNDVGTFIYCHIDGKSTLEEIFNKLLSEYEVEKEVALNDVTIFIEEALKKEIVFSL